MKIAILGASVSEQSVSRATGEVTGYSEVLRREHMAELGATEIVQFAYPGNRTSDGALIRVSDVVDFKPDICIFEPLVEDVTRGRDPRKDEVLFVYKRLVDAGILPVTLMLPAPMRISCKRWPTYALFREICDTYGLPAIEVDLTGVEDMASKFEGIHTRLEGARIYARLIVDGIRAIDDLAALLAGISQRLASVETAIHIQTLAAPKRDRLDEITIRVRLPSDQAAVQIMQRQWIGPFSPVLQVDAGNAVSEKVVWDPYCHYPRTSTVVLLDQVIRGPECTVTLAKVQADPPYETCRRQVDDWPAPEDRHMRPVGGFYIVSTTPVEAELLAYA